MGCTTGIRLHSQGAMVVSFSDGNSPAREAGLQKGDLILAVDDVQIRSNSDLQAALKQKCGCPVTVTVSREGQRKQYRMTPQKDSSTGAVRIGAWVRDSMAGIGTITFVDPQSGAFGALGHGICDQDTGELVPFENGSTMRATVSSVTRGRVGEPGMLNGSYDLSCDSGVILKNTEGGIFGRLKDGDLYCGGQPIRLATRQEVHTGKAHILSNVSGDRVEKYEIEIVKLYAEGNNFRDMMIQVTDKALIEKTGGIVQGMSGSPIIQDGKLVGAVTHVLVNNPTRGYGIFIENMLDSAE